LSGSSPERKEEFMSFRSWLLAAAAGALLGLMQPAVAQQSATPSSEPLVENGWDFNKPDTIPGFGTLPAKPAK
jgi:hypothetical protein